MIQPDLFARTYDFHTLYLGVSRLHGLKPRRGAQLAMVAFNQVVSVLNLPGFKVRWAPTLPYLEGRGHGSMSAPYLC